MANNKKKLNGKTSNAEKPLSLQPLKFDDAMTALLKAKPEHRKTKEAGQPHVEQEA